MKRIRKCAHWNCAQTATIRRTDTHHLSDHYAANQEHYLCELHRDYGKPDNIHWTTEYYNLESRRILE